ncbi:hypothetical protein [Vibrio rumoiensis]|uniref:Uncharacterized protein n=1 Tax=Vibrio rumoiensis TaxID=76258 RepID=A0ABW7IZY7_9VIBR
MNKICKLPFFKRGESNEMAINTISVAAYRMLPHVHLTELSAKQAFQPRFRSQFRNKLLHTEHQEA